MNNLDVTEFITITNRPDGWYFEWRQAKDDPGETGGPYQTATHAFAACMATKAKINSARNPTP